jgi:nucleotide-binding universal stress UspA family protein
MNPRDKKDSTFKRVLLPLDLSDRHDQAVKLALQLVDPEKGEILLLHVIEMIAGYSFDEERTFYERLEKRTRAHMEKIGEAMRQKGIPIKAEIRYGDRGRETVRYAADSGTDLIVLTAPRVDPDNLGWGSLSYKIAVFARCPVLLVK